MQEYVIEYECECGAKGKIHGSNRDDAWKKLEQVRTDHYDKGNRIFSWEEPGA